MNTISLLSSTKKPGRQGLQAHSGGRIECHFGASHFAGFSDEQQPIYFGLSGWSDWWGRV